MRGSAAARAQYATETTVGERPMAVLELNANTGIGYQYAGYYFTSFPSPDAPGTSYDPTAGGTAIPSTFSTYNDPSIPQTKVVGAAFTTGSRRVNRPIVDGSAMTNIPALTYVDEPDVAFEETFSILNCLQPNRPDPGIVRMSTSAAPFMGCAVSRARFYPASREHNFKYWRPANLNSSNPFVYYSRDFMTNKIKIVTQNHIGVPGNFTVEVLPAGSTTWTSVWTQAQGAFPVSGIFKIYYYDGAWTMTPKTEKIHNLSNPVISNAVKIRGIRLRVTSMKCFFNGYATPNAVTKLPPANTVPLDIFPSSVTNNNVPLELIEISARLALDVTESVKSFDTVSAISEDDSALPVGSLIANDASVELENFDRTLSFRNSTSPLYGWEPKRSSLDLYFSTSLDKFSTEVNRVFIGTITDTNESGGGLKITAMDNAHILQNTKVNNFVTLNKTIVSIILMLLDHAGISGFKANFSNYSNPVVSGFPHAENPMIPYYHVNGQTAFEALSDLAEAYQFSLSFDADNVLVMYSKEFLLKRDSATVATFTYDDSGTTLANIKSIEVSPGRPLNDITISYDQKFIGKKVSNSSLGQPMWEAQLQPRESTAWESDSEWLPAAPLVKTLLSTEGISADGVVIVDQEGGDGLKFDGYLLINGEVVAYNAKEYQMKIGAGYEKKWLVSDEQYNYWRDRTASGGRMFFTGRLRIPKGGRAKFGSTVQTHSVETTGLWPYSTSFNSYKFQAKLNGTRMLSKTGENTWNYKGGTVYNVRGEAALSYAPTRNGAESCIRITNATEIEFANYGATLLNPVSASANSAHAYLGPTPLKTDGNRVIPRRIGGGVRILGRVDGDKKPISALGTLGAGGIGMFMRWNASGMQGWYLEIRPTVEVPTNNVTLFEIINSAFIVRKQATWLINVQPPDVNTVVNASNSAWYHLDLAWYPPYGAAPGRFYGYVNGKALVGYTPTAAISESAWFGPMVRGDSYMDVDYTWWSDVSDLNSLNGVGQGDSEPDEYTLEDAIEGAGGPPMWWDSGADALFRKSTARSAQSTTIGINEFGPIAHAIIVKDVEYDDGPYLNPYIATGTKAEFIVPEYELGPFGGKLVIVNARRRAVSVAGDTAPLSVSGFKVESAEQRYDLDEHIKSGATAESTYGSTTEVKIAASRAIHGYIPLEIQTDLIQDRATAKSLLDWIADNCTIECDTLSLEVFGNPLVEPGDKVSVIHPDHGYTASNKFVIMRVENKWENGLITDLILRRVV